MKPVKVELVAPNWFKFPDGATVHFYSGSKKWDCDCNDGTFKIGGANQVHCWHVREMRRRLGFTSKERLSNKGKIWRR